MENSIAAAVRETYIQERRKFESRLTGVESEYGKGHIQKWDGTASKGFYGKIKPDKYGREFKPVWPKIAEFAFKNKVDPLFLIRSVFSNTRGVRPPEPGDMISRAALKLCQSDVSAEFLNQYLAKLEDVFINEVNTRNFFVVKKGWTGERLLRSILSDMTLPMTPLYRHCLASRLGFSDIKDHFLKDACLQYIRNREAYDGSFWKNILTSQLMDAADTEMVSVTEGRS